MIKNTFSLEAFVKNASTILEQTKTDLAELARQALVNSTQSSAEVADDCDPASSEIKLYLQQVSQELAELSERSEALETYLQNGLNSPPPENNHWSRNKILQSQEEERAKLARQLEDTVGQLLANAVFELASCRHLLSGGQDVTAGLDALQAELEQGLADIRHFITDLEPSTVLGSFGLGGGVRRYLEQYEARTGIQTQLRMNTNIGRLPSLIETAIFRVIQETLSNVQNHANAAQVDVVIEEQGEALQFSVIDNGDGLVSEKVGASRKNLGLARMIDYVELLQGDLKVLSEPGRGTQVILTVPHSAL